MFYFLIFAVILFAGGAAFALIRGLLAFSQIGEGIASDSDRAENFRKQNGFMFARVKWQSLAVVAVFLVATLAGTDA
mgnify:FL=1|tara:strand:- start:1982 stop:2212 length:231 start_codon:yes stop_codon:yes gene_type:complete